jgi:hypothetical protein
LEGRRPARRVTKRLDGRQVSMRVSFLRLSIFIIGAVSVLYYSYVLRPRKEVQNLEMSYK